MSHLFYDHLIHFEELNSSLNSIDLDRSQRDEFWQIIDEILHHKILEFILDNLHPYHHDHFIVMYHEMPYENSIMTYLIENVGDNFEKKLENEISKFEKELLAEFNSSL